MSSHSLSTFLTVILVISTLPIANRSAEAFGQQNASLAPTVEPATTQNGADQVGLGSEFTDGLTQAPANANQHWRTYDISAYTSSVKSIPNPEKNVLNWILRETGTDTWFGETTGVLSVGRHQVRCYHTPEVQTKVRGVIDRFIKTQNQDEVFGLQVVTLNNPNWRAKLLQFMTPLETKTPGVEGWIVTKENAALIFNEFRKRADFRVHLTPTLIAESGQPKTIIKRTPLNYFESIQFDNRAYPPFRVTNARIDEGVSLKMSTLRATDGETMDAEFDFRVDQLEKFRRVNVELPANSGAAQKIPIQIPQMSSFQMKERFKWPANRVLVLSMGMIADPLGNSPTGRPPATVFEPSQRRANTLLLVDCKGIYKRGQAPRTAFNLVPVPNRQ